MRIEWKGGTNARQTLEIRGDIVSTTEQWLAICTNLPPTPATTNYLDNVATNGVMILPNQSKTRVDGFSDSKTISRGGAEDDGK